MGVAFLKFNARGVDVQVDELGHVHPHAFKQFLGFFAGDVAFFNVLFVQGVQVLVHAAIGNDGAGLLLDAREHLHKPLALHGFAEAAGRVCGHMIAGFGDLEQLGLTLGVAFLGGQFAGQIGVALGPDHDGIAHHDHGFEEGLFVPQIHRVGQVKGGKLVAGFLLNIEEAALDDLFVVRHPLKGRAVRRSFAHHKFGLEAAFVHIGDVADFGGQGFVKVFVVGLAFPVGGDLFHNNLDVFLRNLEGALVAVFEVGQHLAVKVAVNFGVQNAVAAKLAHAASNKLVGGDVDGHLFGNVLEGLGPAQGQQFAFGFTHGFGEILGAFNVHMGQGKLVLFQNAINALTTITVNAFINNAIFLRGHAATALTHDETPEW